jgi:hypothetical protein
MIIRNHYSGGGCRIQPAWCTRAQHEEIFHEFWAVHTCPTTFVWILWFWGHHVGGVDDRSMGTVDGKQALPVAPFVRSQARTFLLSPSEFSLSQKSVTRHR